MAKRRIGTMGGGWSHYWPRGTSLARARDIVFRLFNTILRVEEIAVAMSTFLLLTFCIYTLTDARLVIKSADLPLQIQELTPDQEFDIEALRGVNRDIVGWLRIDGTDINYPLLQSADNDYYLSRNYLKEWATAGSVFIDYRNAPDLTDNLTIIYGHRMSYGKMFSDVTKYTDRNYFDNHQTGSIYIGDNTYDMKVVAFARVMATEQIIYDVARSRINNSAANYIYNEAIWRSDELYDERHILLSTCDASNKDLRDVLLLKIDE